MSHKLLRIATRKSPLALWQAQHIADILQQHHSNLEIELVKMTTSGDRFLKDKLQTIGGKGLFVKELEEALLANRADIAVHSMKDVPFTLPAGLMIAAISKRENPYDALVSKEYACLADLPPKACVGTSSLRRQSQLLAQRPDLNIISLRGNLQTRLEKLDRHEYDAIVLAVSGLKRMGLEQRIVEIIPESIMLPACGQGALGIECRTADNEILELIAPLNDVKTALCVSAERQVNTLLGGNCHVPLAVYAQYLNTHELLIQAKVASADGVTQLFAQQQGTATHSQHLATQCAEHLLKQGADKLLHIKSI